MDAFTADYLDNLTTDLTASLIRTATRRFKEEWQGEPMAQALRRCTYTAVLAMISRATANIDQDEAAQLVDIFTDFCHNPDVVTELMHLAGSGVGGRGNIAPTSTR